jgi:enterochelin esterase family protein
MTLAIHELATAGPVAPERVREFLAGRRVPIVEGRTVTFLFQGEADAVFLQHWIYGLPSAVPFERLPGADLWYLVQEIPERSRVEYKLEVQAGGLSRLIRDPLNPLLAHDPFGANSVCHGAGYVEPDWVAGDPEARPGRIERFGVPARQLGDRERPLAVYLLARFREARRYPLLVVHDGEDFLRFASLRTVLDNLIHRNEVAPLIVALTQSPDRLREYAADERHGRWLAEELVPWLEARFPLLPGAGDRGLMGASFGAVAAFAAAHRHPGRFERLLLQSGSFAFTDIGPSRRGPAFDPVVRYVNSWRAEPLAVAERVFLSCGVYESLIYENRSLVPLLERTGTTVRYVEALDGHNWENWRDRLREGLTWLFPGPYWLIYE